MSIACLKCWMRPRWNRGGSSDSTRILFGLECFSGTKLGSEGPAGRNANDAPPAWPRGCCASRATDRPPNGREWHDPRLLHVFRGWRRHQRSGLGSARERWTAASDGSAAAIADAEPAPVLALQVLECTGCDKSFRET